MFCNLSLIMKLIFALSRHLGIPMRLVLRLYHETSNGVGNDYQKFLHRRHETTHNDTAIGDVEFFKMGKVCQNTPDDADCDQWHRYEHRCQETLLAGGNSAELSGGICAKYDQDDENANKDDDTSFEHGLPLLHGRGT